MDLKKAVFATLILIALSLAISGVAWFMLPAKVATHFDANWQPNGYGNKSDILLIGPGLMTFVGLLSFGSWVLSKDAVEESGIEPYLGGFLILVEIFLLGLGVFILFKSSGH